MVDRGTFRDMSHLRFVDDRVRSFAHTDTKTSLPDDWAPSAWSVICGRGKECFDHVGNRRFRILIDLNMQKYKDAKSKIEKSMIVMSIVDDVREASVIGGFVRKDPSSQRWHEVPDAIAREKVGQQIRETLTKTNPMKCEARKVQRKSKANRPRQISAAQQQCCPPPLPSPCRRQPHRFLRQEKNCIAAALPNVDTDDTTPLQVDFSPLNSNSYNSIPISISPPPPPPLSQKVFDIPIAFVQSGKFLHKDIKDSQPVPDWQNQQEQELVWNYGEV